MAFTYGTGRGISRYRCSIWLNPLTNNRGMALLLTLLIVTLMTVLVMDVSERSTIALARARNSVQSLKAFYIMRSGVSAAMGFLELDAKSGSIDALTEDWASGVTDLPVGDGLVTVTIRDDASRFNINTLVNPQGIVQYEESVKRFGRLLGNLGLDEALSVRVAEWLKRNRAAYSYSFRDPSELLLVPEVDYDTYKGLEDFVTVYARIINVNTAGVEVLSALSSSLTPDLAGAIVEYRRLQPFISINDLKKIGGIDESVLITFSPFIDVKSSDFEVSVEAKISDSVSRGSAIIKRTANGSRLVRWRED